MEFKKKKEKVLPILKYKVSGNALEDCKERFVIGIKFCNENIIPGCNGVHTINRVPSFYTEAGSNDVIVNTDDSQGSFTVWKNGVFADIIP